MLVACLTVTACHAKVPRAQAKGHLDARLGTVSTDASGLADSRAAGRVPAVDRGPVCLASTKLKRRAAPATLGMGSDRRRVGGDAHAGTTFVLTERDSD